LSWSNSDPLPGRGPIGWSRALLTFGKKPQPVRTFPVSIEGRDVFVDI